MPQIPLDRLNYTDESLGWTRQAISGDDYTLTKADRGKLLFYDEATARALIIDVDTDIAQESVFAARVGPNAGTLTLSSGASVTFTWWNGSAYVVTAAGADLTMGPGLYTIWKDTTTNFYVDGPNLATV